MDLNISESINNYIYVPIALTGISLLGYLSYNTYIFSKRKLKEYVLDQVFKEMDERMRNIKGFEPIKNSQVAKITFIHAGKENIVYVPYDRKSVVKNSKLNYFVFKNNEKININQKPGVRYVISAKDLGGDYISIENRIGEEICRYEKNEIPN